MDEHVSLECTSLFAGVVALCANQRLLSTVNQQVSLQIGSFDARVAAMVAAVEHLSTMLELVRFEIFWHLEGDIAMNT